MAINKKTTMAKHWTVVSYNAAGDWDDESDHYDSKVNASEHAKKLAAASAAGKFTVIEHNVIATYGRSPDVILV